MEWWSVMKGKELIFEEIKNSYKLITLGIFISTMIMSVAVIFLALVKNIMPAVSGNYDSRLENGINAYIQNLSVRDSDVLQKMNVKDICLITEVSSQLYKSSLELEGTDMKISGDYIKCQWYVEDDKKSEVFPEGIKAEKFNYSNSAIVYCSEEEADYYKNGEKLILKLNNGTVVSSFRIEKVIRDNNINCTYVILPSLAVICDMEDKGIIMSYHFECLIPKASQYIDFKNKLSYYGASVKCDFDKMLDLVSILEMVFKVLAIIFVVISVLVIITIDIINLRIRERFLVLLKILGSMDYQILFIYIAILELQIIIADILGCMSGFMFSKHLLNVLETLYGIETTFGHNRIIETFVGSFIISNIALIPCILFIKKIIHSRDVVSVINNKD